MNDKEVIEQLTMDLELAKDHFEGELKKLRTGRAHPNMVEDLIAEAYGTPMALKALATITTPDPQQILISPFDPTNIQAIVTAIRAQEAMGFNPVDDGRIIRIQIPSLTEERRLQIVKQLGAKQEDAFISMRKARHEAIDVVDKAKKDKTIGEDDATRLQKQVDELVNKCKADIEATSKAKEAELLKV